jgi:hypothetical protein
MSYATAVIQYSGNVIMTAEEIKSNILSGDIEDFLDSIILSGESSHFPNQNVSVVASVLSSKFSVEVASQSIYVVGSAKTGYALFKKKQRDQKILPAFRQFGADSDIDLAIVSPVLFELIWDELSMHANRKNKMPWDSGKLGDYMVHGWLRPDLFPQGKSLRRCNDWWAIFSLLSADARFGRRSVRGALYHSLEHLRRYQLRGLLNCRKYLEIDQ